MPDSPYITVPGFRGNASHSNKGKKADVIFFAGGDQLHYTHLYGGTDLLIQLKNKYISDKIVIAGTSAGVMAMSTTMIYAGNEEVQESGGIIKGTTGL